MELTFENEFCEEAVEATLREKAESGNRRMSAACRREADRIYKTFPPLKRTAPFNALYQRFFDRLGLRRRFAALLADVQAVVGPLPPRGYIAKTLTASEEGGQLNRDKTAFVFRLRTRTFFDEGRLRYLLLHESLHIRDLLDPAFGDQPDVPLSLGSPFSESLLRDRYRTLWDLSVDGRLERLGRLPAGVREQRAEEFRALFQRLNPEMERRVFGSFWNGPRPTDAGMRRMILGAGMALPPDVEDAAPSDGTDTNRRGAPCPLCGFPTFEWAHLSPTLIRTTKDEYPEWNPSQGLCPQCANRYLLSAGGFPAAPPICRTNKGTSRNPALLHHEGGW